MAIKSAYNDPALGQAFTNLAQIFAPPSGADLSGYANAAATRADAERRAQLYAQAGMPDFNQSVFDRQAVAAGLYNPTQSYQALDMGDATQRYGYDTAAAAQANVARINNAGALERQYAAPLILDPGQTAHLPQQMQDNTGLADIIMGGVQPLTLSEAQAVDYQNLDDAVRNAIVFGSTPVEQIMGTNGPEIVSRFDSIGQTPVLNTQAADYDNYLLMNEDGTQMPSLGRVGPDGRIMSPTGEDITGRVIRKTGVGSNGMDVEVGPDGAMRIRTGDAAGNTITSTTEAQRLERDAQRVANELTPIFNNLTADDVGVRGNWNDFLNAYGAQLFPNMARQDVAAMRSQMDAASIQLARALSGDPRISNLDREVAQRVMVDRGLGESLPAARAKLAGIIALNAYRSAFASSVLEGEQLPPLNAQTLGQLVDSGALPANVAQLYNQTFLSRQSGPSTTPGDFVNAVTGGAPAAPAPPTPPAPAEPSEGTIIENPATNERLILRNGQWEPFNG